MEEHSEKFGTAHIINDWWNINDYFKRTGYNADFRNTEELQLEQLLGVVEAWDNINTNKNICLFTHARNVKDIMAWRDDFKLPITVITTCMGDDCHQFLEGVLRREYNPEMNDYEGLAHTWEHIHNQITTQDDFWSKHCDINFKMSDWLINHQDVYKKLDLAPQANMHLWCNQYMLFNNMMEEFEDYHVVYTDQRDSYRIQLYVYMFNKYRKHLSSRQQDAFAQALIAQHHSEPRYPDPKEFAAETLKRAKLPLDLIEDIVYHKDY